MSRLKGKDPLEVIPGKCKGLIYGGAGAGKTFFSLEFPTPYFIDSEHGAVLRHYQEKLKKAGGKYFGVEDGSLDFNAVIDQIKALATERHPYKTLVIDSITKLYQITIANEAERLGSKDAFGASKKPAISEMRKLLNWIMKLDMNVFFIAHEISEWGIEGGQRAEIGKTADVWEKLLFELDLVLRVIKRGKEYPATAIVHKSRLLGFPLGETFPLDYDNFSQRYGKDYIEAESKAITLATPEQSAEIIRLIELLKISEEETDKILTKASASNWNELSTEQAAKTLVWLTNKIGGK